MSEEYEDQEVTCSDCNEIFIHSGGEQSFMRSRFGDHYKAPKRCYQCRTKRRKAKEEQQAQ